MSKFEDYEQYLKLGREMVASFGPQMMVSQFASTIMALVDTSGFAEDEEMGAERYVAAILTVLYGYMENGGKLDFTRTIDMGDVEWVLISAQKIVDDGPSQAIEEGD